MNDNQSGFRLLLLFVLIVVFVFGYGFGYSKAYSPECNTTIVEEPEEQKYELSIPTSRIDLEESIRYVKEVGYVTGIPGKRHILILPEDTISFDTTGDSMLPVQGEDSHAFFVPVDDCTVYIGDIVVFNKSVAEEGTFLGERDLEGHRIIEFGEDELGGYFITKGDNNEESDGFKLRCDDILYVQLGVIW